MGLGLGLQRWDAAGLFRLQCQGRCDKHKVGGIAWSQIKEIEGLLLLGVNMAENYLLFFSAPQATLTTHRKRSAGWHDKYLRPGCAARVEK